MSGFSLWWLDLEAIHWMVWDGVSYVCFFARRGSTGGFLLLRFSCGVVGQPSGVRVSQHIVSVELSPRPYVVVDFTCGLFVARGNLLVCWAPPRGPSLCFHHYGSWGKVGVPLDWLKSPLPPLPGPSGLLPAVPWKCFCYVSNMFLLTVV